MGAFDRMLHFTFLTDLVKALGRGNNDPPLHGYDPSIKTVSCSPIPIKGKEEFKVEELNLHDIKRSLIPDIVLLSTLTLTVPGYIGHYVNGAKNAIEAGMDGVEIHGVCYIFIL